MKALVWLKNMKISLGWRVLGAMLLGSAVGRVYRPQSVDVVVGVALFLMLYPPMLEVHFAGVKSVFAKPWLMVAALFLNFLVSPLLIFGLLHLFVGSSGLNLMLGIILYGAVPGGGMAPAFTGMLRGNVNLSVTISAVGSVFTVGIVPLWAKLLIGTWAPVPTTLMFQHLCLIVVVPLTLAVLSRRIIVGRMGESVFLSVRERLKALSGHGLCLMVFTMFMLYGERVLNDPLLVLRIAGPVTAFLVILFLVSIALGKALCACYEDAVALALSTTAKNNAISLALAFSTFGPDAALVNAIAGPLVQMPILLGFVALRKGKGTPPQRAAL
jgi:arsenite transporter